MPAWRPSRSTRTPIPSRQRRGACTVAADDCSLREAIIAANTLAGNDIVSIPADTYTLTIAPATDATTGDLDITSSIDFIVTGGIATIDAGATGDRVLEANCSTPCTVNLSDVVISGGGSTNATTFGGGVRVNTANTSLNLDRVTIANNHVVSTAGSGAVGGGVAILDGIVRISNSTISENSVTPTGTGLGEGGGIHIRGGTLALINTTISGNAANSGSGPSATGGGLDVGNAGGAGGSVQVTNSTITANAAPTASGINATAATQLQNTIVANNTGAALQCAGGAINSLGHNLDADGTCQLNATGDQPGVGLTLLGTLADNGGPTFTHALAPGSPALDGGDTAACNLLTNAFGVPLTTDQRGTGFARVSGGNITPGVGCDIGAFELTVKCNGLPATQVGTNGAGGDTIVGTAGDDVISGLGGIDNIRGGAGNDTICGGTEEDTLRGQAGADILRGEAGFDTVTYQGQAAVTVNMATGFNSDGDTLVGLEVLVGTFFADDLTGSSQPNVIRGLSGADTINGGNGNDAIFGEGGNDQISGGGGDDPLLNGGGGADVIKGGNGNDTLGGDAGNDSLFGNGGDDALNGGDGADVCNGGTTGQVFGDTSDGSCETVTNIP
ncbi:MAG: calcium-binding protein [Dehalococcoidia bacterium]